MSFVNKFAIAPPPWLPKYDQEDLDRIATESLSDYAGKKFENPEFELKIVPDVHLFFAVDLVDRIMRSDRENKKLVLILPSPENAVFMSVVESLNKNKISCRNVHVFFLYEYANEKGDVAPWESPYSRSGHFMRYFYNRLNPELRMPMDQIHFWTKDNVESYSDMIAAEGGADVAYPTISWGGGIGAIDCDTYPAASVEELMTMGSRYVTPMPESIAFDSLRGMFGCSGDIGNVPPCAVTVGPKDLAAAKLNIGVAYATGYDGSYAFQKYPTKLAMMAPLNPAQPACILRLLPGTLFVSGAVASNGGYAPDEDWLEDHLAAIRAKEEV